MNKILKYSYFLTGIFLIANLGACVKDRNTNATDFTQIKPLVEIRTNVSADGTNITGTGNIAGLSNFSRANLTFSGKEIDTTTFYVNLASEFTSDRDISVTLDIDNDALNAYNGDPANGTKFELMPDSLFSFTQKQVTIKKGERVAQVSVQFTAANIDQTVSYMLPISIKTADGFVISGNFGTVYYHVIGNPLGGAYFWNYTRWNSLDTTTSIVSQFEGESTTFAPSSATSFSVSSYYYIQPKYEVSFTNTNGVLSAFKIKLNDADVAAMLTGGVTLTSGPTIQIADPVNKHFRFIFTVKNSSGDRTLIDEFYR